MVRVRAQSRDATRQSPRFILREHKNNYNNLAVKKVLPIFAREGMQIPISEITEKRTLFMFNQIFTKAMRKFYSFLALAILFLAGAGSTSAQDYYDVIDFDYGPEGAVTDIEPGKLYVLQVANTAEANFFNGATDKVSEATPTSLYTFEEAGEQDGFMTYYLKQKGSGLYLSSNGGVSFTDSKLRAFRFFAKHPTMFMERGVDQVPLDVDPTVLCTFDDEHYGGDTPIADRAFIFTDVENCTSDGWEPASEEEQLGGRETQAPWVYFCGHWGQSGYKPFFGPWSDTNSWYLYEVGEKNAFDQLEAYIMDQFSAPDADDYFTPGDQMGQVSPQDFAAFEEALNTAYNLVNEGGGRPAQEYLDAFNALKNAFETCRANTVGMEEGYYMLSDKRSNKWAYENASKKLQAEKNHATAGERPEITEDEMAYIFRFIRDNKTGGFIVQNFLTDNYVKHQPNGGNVSHDMVENMDEAEAYTVETHPDDASYFAIRSTTEPSMGFNTDTSNNGGIVRYSYTDAGSLWKLYPISAEEVAPLEAIKEQKRQEIAQKKLNDELQKLVGQADARYRSAQAFTSDADEDGSFDQMGIVTDPSKLWTNAPLVVDDGIQPVELESLLDNDVTTQFHSAWQWATGERFAWHSLCVELDEPLSTVAVKYSKRTGNNQLGAPILCHFYTTNDTTGYTADDYSGWTDQGYVTFTYPYSFPEELGATPVENMVGIAAIQFNDGQKWKYFRFDVEDNLGSNRNASTGNLYFNMGEFRVFAAEYDAENALLSQIPAEVTNALLSQIAASRTQLDEGKATQEQIDALKEAYDAFNEEYPDVNALREYIDDALAVVDGAEEGSQIGYFESGAREVAEAAIVASQNKVQDKMTAAEIKQIRKEVAEALATLNTKLVKPENGVYYRIISNSTSSGTQNGNYIYASGSGESNIRWSGSAADAELTSKLNSIWKAIRNEDGTYSFQNAFTGDYLNASEKAGTATKNGEATKLNLAFAGVAGSFEFMTTDEVCLNCDPNGNVVTYYHGDANAKLGFVEEDQDPWTGDQVITPTDEYSIVTLPFAIDYLDVNVYSILGKNLTEGKLELQVLNGAIPAGTPFIVKRTGSNVIYATPVAETFEAIEYAAEPATVDGLVGVYGPMTLPNNCGIFYRANIVKSSSGDKIAANSGYFVMTDVPDVTTAGDISIPIDPTFIDVINGVEVISVNTLNAGNQGTFDLQGRRVAKAQKGLYIINGKKVLVK